MALSNSGRYGVISQAFHWVTVGLIVALLWTGWGADVEADKPGNTAFFWHVDRDDVLRSMLPGRKPL